MVTSLACARDWLLGEPCIASYSDIFYAASAVTALMETDAPLAITYDTQWLELWRKRFGDPLLDAETFRLNDDHTLAEIGGKPRSLDEIQGQYMGLLRFTPAGWREVERIRNTMPQEQQDRMHMTGTLQEVIKAGCVPVTAVPYKEQWGEVDNVEDLKAY